MPTLGFDLSLYCDNLKATKPPYKCPVPECGRVYKSYSGIRFHLYKFDHDNPENNSSAPSPAPSESGKKKPGGGRRSAARLAHHRSRRSPTPPDFRSGGPTRERTLTYAESQRLVEIDLDGRTHRLNIFEPLSVVTQDAVESEVEKPVVEEEKVEKPVPLSKPGKEPKKKEIAAAPHPPHPASKLPEASYKVLMDYVKCPPAPARPSNYYRFMEKSTDELDDEIEYDMDEEDYAWLELINEKRKKENLSSVTQEIFETLMDRFEKEAFFQSQTSGQDSHPSIDEDAVCSICMDGECQNSNVILFCDMCNLAVHQECYGVPYIPEGQWLCRRCLQSPSCAVDCSLCPNKGGAFKQTDDGRWAHVVCALWIPEVGFANTVFLEPIDSVDHIPPARWKLMCYICKQRGAGACIQCHKTNCYTAFHVTCAQQAGLFMKIEPIRETNVNGVYVSVRKTAFCDVHMPADHGHGPMINNGDENEDKSIAAKVAKAKSRQKMRKARKILAEKRNAMPVVSIPMIPPHRLSKIATRISLAKKQPFVLRLQSYWTLKRQSRNGVPLLRRLQSNHMSRNKEQTKNDKQSNELKAQLKYWQRLRQDLEKARLLVELIRKREKLKREQLRLHQLTVEMQLHPFVVFLRTVIDQLQEKDASNIFAEPVSLKEVPDYLDYIKHPMDFQTMRDKIEGHYYNQMDDFEADFNTMISNCMTYNAKDTVFYRAAVKLRDVGGAIIRASRRMAEKIGYDPDTGLHLSEPPPVTPQVPETLESIESFLPPEVRADMPLEEQLRILLDKMDIANAVKQGGRKSKLAKQIRKEIVKVRRQLALQRGHTSNDPDDRYSETDHDSSATEPLSPKSPPLKLGRVPKSPKALKSPGLKSTGPKSPRSPGPKPPLPKTPTTPKAPSTPKAPTTPRQTTAPKLPSTPKLSELKPPPSPVKTANTTAQKRKGRPGRPRVRSTKSESEPEPQTSTPVAAEIKSTEGGTEVAAPSETSEKPPADTSTTSASPSPSGVNRRTSVLFSKKALKTRKPQPLQLDATPQPQRKGPGRPPKVKQPKPQIFPDGDKEEPSEKAKDDAMKSPKSPGRQSRKRTASTSIAEMSSAQPPKRSMSTTIERPEAMSVASPKRSLSVSEPLSPRSPKSPKQPRSPSPKNIQQRESFLQYRIDRSLSSSESDTSSETSNTDSTDSDSSSNASSDGSGDGDDKTPRYSRRERKKKKKRRISDIEGAIEGQEEHADDGGELLKPASLRRTDRAEQKVEGHEPKMNGQCPMKDGTSAEEGHSEFCFASSNLNGAETSDEIKLENVPRDENLESSELEDESVNPLGKIGVAEKRTTCLEAPAQKLVDASGDGFILGKISDDDIKTADEMSGNQTNDGDKMPVSERETEFEASVIEIRSADEIVVDIQTTEPVSIVVQIPEHLTRSKSSQETLDQGIHALRSCRISGGCGQKTANVRSESETVSLSRTTRANSGSEASRGENENVLATRAKSTRQSESKKVQDQHNIKAPVKVTKVACSTATSRSRRRLDKDRAVVVKPNLSCYKSSKSSATSKSGVPGRAVRTKTRFMPWDEDEEDLVPLEPLDLVWAKCRGYPWYPALIINPKMPKTGYFHNGVPIPVPPEDVLGLQRKFDELVYLVLFFDTKRTWQWLPRGKLEPLGVDSGLDKAKLAENKKPNIRKAVKLAYEKAIMHRCRVTGEPNPFVPSESESDTEMEFEIGGKNEKLD